MSSYASAAGWKTGSVPYTRTRGPRRGWEIAGIILGFVFAWPLALAYLVWKFAGYPVPNVLHSFFEQNFSYPFAGPRGPASFRSGGTGNLAFEEYRRSELDRLEAERRRLDEEAQAFGGFVEELKRAKDREEFDAFMRRRRGDPSATA